VTKPIGDCQTPEELAESIAYHLKQGGMHRDYSDQTGLRETKYDEFETKRLYGTALNKYNEIRKLYPNCPSLQIATSDSLSGLAQIQQLCASKQESLQEIIEILKNWQKSKKTEKDFETAKLALPPIAKTYDILCRSKGQCGAKTTDIIRWLGTAARDKSGYYRALFADFASPQVITDLEEWQEKPAETEHENRDTKRKREGMIEPKPPEILQKALWVLKYGRHYWKLILLVVFVILISSIFVLPKFDLFGNKHQDIPSETGNTLRKPIVVASATVEVKIRSDWDFNGRVANTKAYLAFVKGNKPLLIASSIGYTANQTGNDEVVYKAELDMDAKDSAVGNPASFLKDAEYIQIEFGRMPSDSDVLEGGAVCIINNSVRLEFSIPPQKLVNNRIFIRNLSESVQVLNEPGN
jgi:hypothetical protein